MGPLRLRAAKLDVPGRGPLQRSSTARSAACSDDHHASLGKQMTDETTPVPTKRPPITATEGAAVAAALVATIAWAMRQFLGTHVPEDIQGYMTVVIVYVGARVFDR